MTDQWLIRPDPDMNGRWWIDKAPDADIPGQTIGPPVANVFFEDHARLIAAAPDLLAALENIIRLATDANSLQHAGVKISPAMWSALFQACSQARAAIAKARH